MRETIGFEQKVGLMRLSRTRAYKLRPLNPWQLKASAKRPSVLPSGGHVVFPLVAIGSPQRAVVAKPSP
jgi:hypothetical protein